MAERKSLSKKTRFEVFKRDSFTCQYCGRKAPDVILEVDHINPVKEDGGNELMNLVTSCFECNRGKSAKKLGDNSVVEKQRIQIEELNLRRQQLEMMLEWRDGMKGISDDSFNKANSYWEEKTDSILNDYGKIELRKLVDKFGVINVLDAIDISASKYLHEDGAADAFNKLGGILFLKNAPEYKKKISYIKGICRNMFNRVRETELSILLNKYHKDGFDLDELIKMLKSGEFRSYASLYYFLNTES